jgi:hypothetical protein
MLIVVATYPFAFGMILGEPFSYLNDTFPVCLPDQMYLHDDECVKPPAGFAYRTGQLVPMLVQKCYRDPFNGPDVVVYTIHRQLVSDQNGVRIAAGDTFATVRKGCHTLRQSLHAVPPETPPGVYHFEGFSELRSWRLQNVPWRSASFADAYRELWRAVKSTVPLNPEAGIYKEWRRRYAEWGSPIGAESKLDSGGVYQVFTHAIVCWTPERGIEVVADA